MKLSKWGIIAGIIFNFFLASNSYGAEIIFKNTPMSPIDSDNGKLVYMSYTYGNWDIFLYDTKTGEEKQLTSDLNTQGYPSISGKYVVWMDNRNKAKTKGSFDIYLYNIETGEEKNISQVPSSQEYPDIDGNRVVWEDHSDFLSKIVVYDINSGNLSIVSDNVTNGSGPRISGDIVTWTDVRYGNPDIYACDLSDGLETTIAEGKAIQAGADVSGNSIVWVDRRNGNMDIYLYDLKTKIEKQLTATPGNETSPQFFGNTVIYNTPSKIPAIYDISTGKTTPLDTQGQPVERFFVVDGKVNWTKQDAEIAIASSSSSSNKPPDILFDQVISDHTSLKFFDQEKGITVYSSSDFEKPSRVTIKILEEKKVSPHPNLELVSNIFSIISSQPMENGLELGILPNVAENTYGKLGIYSHDGYKWNYVGGKWLTDGLLTHVKDKLGGHFAAFLSNITFKDVERHWAKQSIETLAAKQIVNGFKEGSFLPEQNITRAEFAAMLVKTLGIPPVTDKVNFKDISSSHWAFGLINTALTNGLVTGDNKLFKPDAPITREEMATMIVRAQEKIKPYQNSDSSPNEYITGFKDSNLISLWARQAINKAAWSGLIKGSENQFKPRKLLTRAEAASILYRLLELNKLL